MKFLPAVFVLLLAGGCKDDDPAPTTGSLVVYYANSGRYALYTESLFRTGPPLQEGLFQMNGAGNNRVTINDLNPGTYIFQIGPAGNNFNNAVQVTAGKVREYTF